MSAKLMGQVWDLDLPHNEAWVLMALADHADHDGKNVYPGVDLIAYKTGYSHRQVQRILDSLEKKNLIQSVANKKGGRGLIPAYEMHLDKGDKKASFDRFQRMTRSRPLDDAKDDILSGKRVTSETEKGDISDTKRVTSETEKGDISGLHIRKNRHEPSWEPSKNQGGGSAEKDRPLNSVLPVLAKVYRNIAKTERDCQSLTFQSEELSGEGFTGEDVKEWIDSIGSLPTPNFIAREFRLWRENRSRKAQRSNSATVGIKGISTTIVSDKVQRTIAAGESLLARRHGGKN